MVEIGDRPMLWHIMKIYSSYGIIEFIVCLGYKGYMIKEYFANYFLHMSDVTIDISKNSLEVHQNQSEPWKVTLVQTGDRTQTGGRLRRVREHIEDETFCMTYGDGVGDIDIAALVEFHEEHGRTGDGDGDAATGPLRRARRGGGSGPADKEKPKGDGGWINGGFFVLSPDSSRHDRRRRHDLGVRSAWPSWRRRRTPGVHAPWILAPHGHAAGSQLSRRAVESWQGAVEDLEVNAEFLGRSACVVTGHTGFIGSWLSLLASEPWSPRCRAGSRTSHDPESVQGGQGREEMDDIRGDVRDSNGCEGSRSGSLRRSCSISPPSPSCGKAISPRPDVRHECDGTAHVLEPLRHAPPCRAGVIMTTDKCYEKRSGERVCGGGPPRRTRSVQQQQGRSRTRCRGLPTQLSRRRWAYRWQRCAPAT